MIQMSDKDAQGGSKEDVLRKRVAQLRIREVQLQMIVILETLALQSLATSPTDQSGELPSIGRIDGTSDGKTAIFSKSKKLLDLTATHRSKRRQALYLAVFGR